MSTFQQTQQNTTGMTTMMSPGAGMPQDILEVAASLLDRSLQADRNYADLSEQLQIPKHSTLSRSAILFKLLLKQ